MESWLEKRLKDPFVKIKLAHLASKMRSREQIKQEITEYSAKPKPDLQFQLSEWVARKRDLKFEISEWVERCRSRGFGLTAIDE